MVLAHSCPQFMCFQRTFIDFRADTTFTGGFNHSPGLGLGLALGLALELSKILEIMVHCEDFSTLSPRLAVNKSYYYCSTT